MVSAAALAYEILLMRLFSIIQWHHFAYMAIGLALLGYGFSGTLVSLASGWLLPRFRRVYIACLGLFGVLALVCFALAQAIPFNAEAILWNPRQTLYLLAIFLLLSLPFFFASGAICLALMAFRRDIARVYAVDLIGAGVGSIAVVLMLAWVLPLSALLVIAVSGPAAALVAVSELKIRRPRPVLLMLLAVMLLLGIGGQSLQLTMSPYKELSQTLRIGGTHIVDERSSPLGLLTVVASDQVPFRHAPGLSLNARQEPLEQLALFTDGGNMSVITRLPDALERLAYLDQTSSALPYHLGPIRHLLVVGVGGGSEVLQGLYHRSARIDALELNPQVVDLVDRRHGAFSGPLYQQPGVHIHVSEARGFLSAPGANYDLIQLALLDAFNASASGLYALSESYLYTREALSLYLDRLTPGGYLAITRWIKIPPRDTLKMFATAVEALRRRGSPHPGAQLLLIRGWQTSTLVVKNGRFDAEELAAARKFCRQRSFDLAWAPDMKAAEANRYNRLREPLFFSAATAMLGDDSEAFFKDYKFDLRPADDDRPYFHHFLKWSVLAEILSLRERGGMALIEGWQVNV
jgi:spermidine synthase